jgi:hypothetical protein
LTNVVEILGVNVDLLRRRRKKSTLESELVNMAGDKKAGIGLTNTCGRGKLELQAVRRSAKVETTELAGGGGTGTFVGNRVLRLIPKGGVWGRRRIAVLVAALGVNRLSGPEFEP